MTGVGHTSIAVERKQASIHTVRAECGEIPSVSAQSAAGACSSVGGGEFGELLLLPRPRAARLLEKIGASLTEESAHFGFGPTPNRFRPRKPRVVSERLKYIIHHGALQLEFGRQEVPL